MVYLASTIIVFLFLGWLANAILAPFYRANARAAYARVKRNEFDRWRTSFWNAHGRLPEERDWEASRSWHEETRRIQETNGYEWMGNDPTLEKGYRGWR